MMCRKNLHSYIFSYTIDHKDLLRIFGGNLWKSQVSATYAAWPEKCTLAPFVEKMYVYGALTMIRGHVFNALAQEVLALTLLMEKVASELDTLRPEQIFYTIFYFYLQRTI